MSCHKPAPGFVSGYFENVAFKSQAIQLGIDDAREIVRFDPKTLKVIDAGVAKTPEHMREVRKGHETLVSFVEKDGQRWATEIRFKGPVKVAEKTWWTTPEEARRPGHRQLRADRLAPLAALPAGHHPGIDQRALSGVGQGGEPPARGQGCAAGVFLPRRNLPDEPAVAAQGDCARLQEHEGLSRGHPSMGNP
jgi:hypothetical protein